MAKILKSNGQVPHLSSHHALTEEEWLNEEEKKARKVYDDLIAETIGAVTMITFAKE